MGKVGTRRLPVAGGHGQGFAATTRTDPWWSAPAITFAVLTLFVVYTTWAALQGEHYYADPYLSPFYSPVLFSDPTAAGAAPLAHAWFGAWPSWWPGFLPISPAILILVFPGSFRFTCYYYRKAYYRSFGGSPPGCAVGPLRSGKPYRGETGFFTFQNLHRYALYFALVFVLILGYDAVIAFFRDGTFGVGVGSVVLTINVFLLAGYTFGCHSFRHLIGGRDDCMSCGKQSLTYGAWKRASWLNARHMQFAWLSLFWVMFADLYVRLVSMGVITDLNTWN
jgi:hypothetical protein